MIPGFPLFVGTGTLFLHRPHVIGSGVSFVFFAMIRNIR